MRLEKLIINQVSFLCVDIEKADIELVVNGVSNFKEGKRIIQEFIDLIKRTPTKHIRIG